MSWCILVSREPWFSTSVHVSDSCVIIPTTFNPRIGILGYVASFTLIRYRIIDASGEDDTKVGIQFLRSKCSSTSTASSTKDCTRASAPVRDFSATSSGTSVPFCPSILSVSSATPIVSSDTLLLYHSLSHYGRVYFGAHWDTRVYMGWLASVSWYLRYYLFGHRYQCSCVGARYVGCWCSLSCSFVYKISMPSKASTGRRFSESGWSLF